MSLLQAAYYLFTCNDSIENLEVYFILENRDVLAIMDETFQKLYLLEKQRTKTNPTIH